MSKPVIRPRCIRWRAFMTLRADSCGGFSHSCSRAVNPRCRLFSGCKIRGMSINRIPSHRWQNGITANNTKPVWHSPDTALSYSTLHTRLEHTHTHAQHTPESFEHTHILAPRSHFPSTLAFSVHTQLLPATLLQRACWVGWQRFPRTKTK